MIAPGCRRTVTSNVSARLSSAKKPTAFSDAGNSSPSTGRTCSGPPNGSPFGLARSWVSVPSALEYESRRGTDSRGLYVCSIGFFIRETNSPPPSPEAREKPMTRSGDDQGRIELNGHFVVGGWEGGASRSTIRRSDWSDPLRDHSCRGSRRGT